MITVNDMIKTTLLQNGEYAGICTLEITSIPHISILESEYSNKTKEEILFKYKVDMQALISELYQNYKLNSNNDISYELLWVTTPVENQTFKAKIKLFINVRAINKSNDALKASIQSSIQLIKNSLTNNKYDVESVVDDTEFDLLRKKNNMFSLSKETRVINLQNQMVPYCYTADRLLETQLSLDKIVNTIVDYPYSILSLQLTPILLSDEEKTTVEQMGQVLNSLSQGIMEMGNISISAAQKPAENYKYYAESKDGPLFRYSINVFSDDVGTSNISSRVFGQLVSVTEEKNYLTQNRIDNLSFDNEQSYFLLPWLINQKLDEINSKSSIWSIGVFSKIRRFPYIVTEEEASEFFRLPIGDENVSAGLNVNEAVKAAKTYADNIINGGDIEVGKLRSSSKGDTIGFNLKNLAKHMLVVGTPGSGKTTFSVGMLDRLWKEHHVPFLVIEPAKNEYRALVQSIPDLQVFTPGKNFISPFVYNPFVPPKNVKLETYKSTLKTAFAAGVSMTTPLDKIFEEAINNCYSDFRWLDTYTTDNKGKIFNITDFIKCFQQTFDEIGYTGDAKNIGRAGVVRLNSLVNLFDNYYSIPIEDLLSKPTIIELAAIENAEQKSLIIALLLLSILSYVNANYIGEGGLKNVILLEEAHVLLDSDSSSGQGEANPSSIAQGLIKRMLAEIRSYGVGLVIADQSPRKVGTDVVALTDMKVVFRLVEAADKQIIADSSNMSDAMFQRMSKLKPGEAFLFFNKLDEPEEVITPDYRLENNISISLSDDGIKSLSTYWKNKPEMLKPYPECNEINYCKQTCDYNQRVLAREVARRIYVKNFKPDSTDFELVKKVFSKISLLIKYELNDEPFTPELLSCVKVHLWRRIKYSTKIKINEKLIENSLRK